MLLHLVLDVFIILEVVLWLELVVDDLLQVVLAGFSILYLSELLELFVVNLLMKILDGQLAQRRLLDLFAPALDLFDNLHFKLL